VTGLEAREGADHAAPSCTEVAVDLAERGITVFLDPVRRLVDEVFDLLLGGTVEDVTERAIVGATDGTRVAGN